MTAHLSRDEIERVLSQAANPAEAFGAMSHLFACLSCLVQAEEVLRRRSQATGTAAELLRRYLDLQQDNVVEMLFADAQWGELKNLSPKLQKDRIATTAICRTGSFVRLLMDELKATRAWDEAERLASLIAASVNAMSPKDYPPGFTNDLRGEVLIELANSRRRAAEWKRADDAIQRADSFLVDGSGSLLLRGRRLSVSASLEADRGRLDSALDDLEEAKAIYEHLGDPPLIARTLLQAANALSEPDPKRGLILLDEADPHFSAGDPLLLNARICRIDCLIWTGQIREAISHALQCERPLGRMQIRYRFIGGRLLQALGHRKEAEKIFQNVVTEDLENALYRDALLDLLWLLKVHVSEGDTSKALAVCRRALCEVLGDSHDQLRGVWQQVQKAIETKAFVPETLPSLKQYMALHWRHPAPAPPAIHLN